MYLIVKFEQDKTSISSGQVELNLKVFLLPWRPLRVYSVYSQ